MNQPKNLVQKAGFTLIELSIVLVIIGLIVGGVLVGQDLIKAAELRATVAQIEKTNAATNTFRTKYNAIPGDINATQATAFGIFAETTSGGTVGHGDGNGLLEGAAAGSATGRGETLTYWRHLSDANLTDGQYGSIGNSEIVATTGLLTGDVTNIAQSLPPAKIGRGNYIAVYSPLGNTSTFGVSAHGAGRNFFEINGISLITSATGGYTAAPAMSPIEAANIDTKVDDGQPNTGQVRATGGAAGGLLSQDPVTTASTGCVTLAGVALAAIDRYTLPNETPACGLRFNFN